MFCGVPIKGSDLRKYQARHLAANDYYEKSKSVEGRRQGGNLAAFGLEAGTRVEGRAFSEMADGKRGDGTGASWIQRHGRERRPFYDFTVSAPKSFSVACIVGGDERIREWHGKAVDAALKAVEADTRRRMRNQGFNDGDLKRTGNLAVARYHHDASRLLDPQLHEHLCIFNGTVDPDDGKVYAVDYGAIMERSHLYTAIYRHALADQALKGGYDIALGADGAPEIAGLDKARKSLSRRTDVIEEVSTRYRESCGLELTKRQRKSVSLISRGVDMPLFRKEWEKRMDGIGKLSRSESFQELTALLRDCGGNAKISETTTDEVRRIQKVRLGGENLAVLSQTVEKAQRKAGENATGTEFRDGGCVSVADALQQAMNSIFEMKSVVKDHELIEKALSLSPISESAHQELCDMLERAVQSGVVLRSDSGMLTTAETLRMEGELIERAKSSRATFQPIRPSSLNPSLSEEQREAVCGVLASGDKITAIVGDAGSGKTFATAELAKAALDSKINVCFLAPTTGARDVLRKADAKCADIAGAFNSARTLQKVLHGYAAFGESGMKRGSCVILDEAGMVSVKMMSMLMDICEKEGHRLVLIGDYKQHAPVEAGGAFRLLIESGAVASHRISEIKRQSKDAMGGAYRVAASLMAAGKIGDAFALLDKAGTIIELQGVQRIEAMAKSYVESLKAGRSCLCVNYTHRENDAVSARIRELLKSDGLLKEGRKFAVFRPLNIGNADKTAAYLHPGVWLVENPGTSRERAWQISSADSVKGVVVKNGPATKTFDEEELKRCVVCERRELEIAKGEFLSLRTNLRGETDELPNGACAIVAGLTPEGFPIDETGNVLRTRLLDYGYATTSHKSQGSTCDDVIISFDYRSTAVADAKMAYVASTRGRRSLKIFCDSKEDLQLVANRSGDAPLAMETFFADDAQTQKTPSSHPVKHLEEWTAKLKQMEPVIETALRQKIPVEPSAPSRVMHR